VGRRRERHPVMKFGGVKTLRACAACCWGPQMTARLVASQPTYPMKSNACAGAKPPAPRKRWCCASSPQSPHRSSGSHLGSVRLGPEGASRAARAGYQCIPNRPGKFGSAAPKSAAVEGPKPGQLSKTRTEGRLDDTTDTLR
jgi:hypothetical protein